MQKNTLGMLLVLLHSRDGLPPRPSGLSADSRHLQGHPHLIWPMLLWAQGVTDAGKKGGNGAVNALVPGVLCS